MRGTCPARNSVGQPCRFPGVWKDGRCPYHTRSGRILPGEPVRRRGKRRFIPEALPRPDPPVYDPDRLPTLSREITLNKLRPWAAEFMAFGGGTALEFVEWLVLETAPPRRPKEDGGPVYSVVGAAALALRR